MNQTTIRENRDKETRQFYSFELRTAEKEEKASELYIHGLAAVFNSPTVLYEYDGVEYKEQIDRSAFDTADMSDVILNYNHSGKVLARTRNNTLFLWTEADGLHIKARLDGTADGRALYEEIKGGYIDRMSFAFTVKESEYNTDKHLRTILKIKKVYDVSAVSIPAYDNTSISARNFFETAHKAACAARLHKEILQTSVKTTLNYYGG